MRTEPSRPTRSSSAVSSTNRPPPQALSPSSVLQCGTMYPAITSLGTDSRSTRYTRLGTPCSRTMFRGTVSLPRETEPREKDGLLYRRASSHLRVHPCDPDEGIVVPVFVLEKSQREEAPQGLSDGRASPPLLFSSTADRLTYRGLANSYFWVDPTTGLGAVILAQFLPWADEDMMKLSQDLEAWVFENVKCCA